MLSLGCERLPTPLKKVLDYYLHHDLGMLSLLWCFFAHLLILQYPDHHQNLISSSCYYSGPVHKISSQSVHNFLSNVVHRQTNRQTDRQTNQHYQKRNLLCQGGNYISRIDLLCIYHKFKQPVAYRLGQLYWFQLKLFESVFRTCSWWVGIASHLVWWALPQVGLEWAGLD